MARSREKVNGAPRRKSIEILLSRLDPHSSPKIMLEQYTIPAGLAADLLYWAGFVHDDLRSRTVVDLGTGSGRLAIGACLFRPELVVGVDIDRSAVMQARRNASLVNVSVEWIVADIDSIEGAFETAIMNPPFGTRNRHKDVSFLSKAVQIANVIYTIHKRSTRQFIGTFVKSRSAKIDELYESVLEIPRSYSFHEKRRHLVDVDLLRIVSFSGGIRGSS